MRQLLRTLLTGLLAFGLLCLVVPAAVASAAAPAASTVAVVAVAATITLAPALVAAVVSVAAPFVVGLISNLNAAASLKQFLGGLVALVIAAVTTGTLADGTAVISLEALAYTLASAVAAFLVQQASYTALWRRLGINRFLAPQAGLGRPKA